MASMAESKDTELREEERLKGNLNAALHRYRADIEKHPEYVHAVGDLVTFYSSHGRMESARDLSSTAKQLIELHGNPEEKPREVRGMNPKLSKIVVRREPSMPGIKPAVLGTKPGLIRRIFRRP